ncbi:MAG: PA4642 family protein [Paraperlucidibaca sp.]
MAVSQPATFDETWSDERIVSFLAHQPPAGESADFHVLYNAYKHMRVTDFKTLLSHFNSAGRDLHARNDQGQSLLDIVRTHPQSQAFAELLSA